MKPTSPIEGQIPGPVQNVTVKGLGEDWLIINWSSVKNFSNNVDRYVVFHRHCSVADLQSNNVSRNENEYRINDLVLDSCYVILVKACNKFGCSNASDELKARTLNQDEFSGLFMNKILPALVVGVVFILICCCACFYVRHCRLRRNREISITLIQNLFTL